MLSKLMKYDLRSCFRRFGVLWIATAAFAVLTGIMMHGVFEKAMESGSFILRFLTILVPVILIGLIIVTGVLTFVFICERFYKGLLGDEGYLMFTLPASVSEHIAAKALSAMILTIISSLVALVSGLIFLLIYQPAELMEGLRMLPQILKEADLPASVPLFLLEILVLILFTVAKETLKIYASIALGHLAKKHRVLWAILAYFGITTLESLARGLVISNGSMGRRGRLGYYIHKRHLVRYRYRYVSRYHRPAHSGLPDHVSRLLYRHKSHPDQKTEPGIGDIGAPQVLINGLRDSFFCAKNRC